VEVGKEGGDSTVRAVIPARADGLQHERLKDSKATKKTLIFLGRESVMGQIVEMPAEVERFATTCVDVGVDVHRVLGPGFKEIIYERAYCLELHVFGH
jgi:hypothetical protein